MKIGVAEIFNNFNKDSKEIKLNLLKEKEGYENSKIYLITKLNDYEFYIRNFTNIQYSEIKDLTRMIAEKSLINMVDLAGMDISIIRRTLNMIVEINRSLDKVNKDLNKIEKNLIDKDIFTDIIYKFNNKLSDEIVFKGYFFRLGYGLGHIRIKKVDALFNSNGTLRTKKRINWDESNKFKKELVLQGKLPYKVLERDEERNIIKDNGGEKWFIYHSQPYDYLWHWHKNHCLILNSPYYKFRPTIYNNTTRNGKRLGNVNKLKQLVTSKSELLKNFYV